MMPRFKDCTKKIQDFVFEIIGCLGKCFPKDFTSFVFGEEPNMNLIWHFSHYIVLEFIKYSYDIKSPKYPLRHFLNYTADDSTDRMWFSRIIKYSQKYRDLEYDFRIKKAKSQEERDRLLALKAKPMDKIDDRLKGYDISEMNFFELDTMLKMPLIKSIVEKRIISSKKVSNDTFRDFFKEYEEWVDNLLELYQGSDEECVFASLAFFTIEWKYAIETLYHISSIMDENEMTDFDDNIVRALVSEISFYSRMNLNVSYQCRMIVERNLIVDDIIEDELLFPFGNDYLDRYVESLTLACLIKEQIQTEDGVLFKDFFADQTDIHDWASFFRFYNVFEIRDKEKDWNNKRIKNMRYLFGKVIKEN